MVANFQKWCSQTKLNYKVLEGKCLVWFYRQAREFLWIGRGRFGRQAFSDMQPLHPPPLWVCVCVCVQLCVLCSNVGGMEFPSGVLA